MDRDGPDRKSLGQKQKRELGRGGERGASRAGRGSIDLINGCHLHQMELNESYRSGAATQRISRPLTGAPLCSTVLLGSCRLLIFLRCRFLDASATVSPPPPFPPLPVPVVCGQFQTSYSVTAIAGFLCHRCPRALPPSTLRQH